MQNDVLLDAINEARVLGAFKQFCEDYSNDKQKLRNILANSTDKENTVTVMAKRDYGFELDCDQARRMLNLLTAFLKKSSFRKTITIEIREKLLNHQNYECAFCHKTIDLAAHADHIVPFKYVGDELQDNLQMLCTSCNEKKNDSLDYQIKVLLKLV